jgi:uncharacterized protein (DUF486 family)
MRTIILLFLSNIFMTFAWYYHLKHEGWPLWKAILISWLIALVEYCLAVPANRLGHSNGFNLFQLKIIQEVEIPRQLRVNFGRGLFYVYEEIWIRVNQSFLFHCDFSVSAA